MQVELGGAANGSTKDTAIILLMGSSSVALKFSSSVFRNASTHGDTGAILAMYSSKLNIKALGKTSALVLSTCSTKKG